MSDYIKLAKDALNFAKKLDSDFKFKFSLMKFENGKSREEVVFKTEKRWFYFASLFNEKQEATRSDFSVLNSYSSFLTDKEFEQELELFAFATDCFEIQKGDITEIAIKGEGAALDEVNKISLIEAFHRVLES